MKRAIRIVAIVVLLAGGAVWLATGANRGWTKTSVEKRTLDEITGIEGITYERRFVPGVDFLGATAIAAAALAGVSFLFRNKATQSKTA